MPKATLAEGSFYSFLSSFDKKDRDEIFEYIASKVSKNGKQKLSANIKQMALQLGVSIEIINRYKYEYK